MGLGEQMQAFMEEVNRRVPTTEIKSEMTKAGAHVYTEHLKSVTKRSNNNDVNHRHLVDEITSQNTDIDNEPNGNSVAGFKDKAYIARFLNDGTVKMKATHFVDNARLDSREAVFAAEKQKYEELMGGDH